MPKIYLSPSTQEYNQFVTGTGSEEYYMNLIADALEPYLFSSGIQFSRNTPDMTAASSIKQANKGDYDFYLAIHSNAGPPDLAGVLQGPDIYYYPGSADGKRMADIMADNFKAIYPNPELVNTLPTTYLGEVTKTRFPAVLVEVAYHDNPDDANWIIENIGKIAEALALSLTEHFGIPFVEPQQAQTGVVEVESGNLNLRAKPSVMAEVVATIPNGTRVSLMGQWEDWYVAAYGGKVGYVYKSYVRQTTDN